MKVEFSKQTNNWRTLLLKDFTTIIMGQSPPSNSYNSFGQGLPFFQGKAEFAELNPVVVKWCSNPKKIAEIGDILISVRAPVGSLNIADTMCCIGRGLAAIRYTQCYKFLYYRLMLSKGDLEKKGTGTTFKAISGDVLRNLEIHMPPLEMQHRIVEKIEELFSELDKGIEYLKTAQAQLKVYRQAVLKWAFEGKLTRDRDIVAELEKKAEPGRSKLPDGWKWVRTGDVMNSIDNGHTPTKEFLSQGNGEIPFVKVYNLNFDGTLDFTKNPTFIPEHVHEKKMQRSLCISGDVLINIVGPPLGKVSVVPNSYPEWNINQAIVRFRPNERIISKFLLYYLQNPMIINWLENTSKATAGQYNVKVSTCRIIPLPLPDIEQQLEIVQEIESRLSVCDKLEESIEQSLQQSEALRQSILKRAFEGRLV